MTNDAPARTGAALDRTRTPSESAPPAWSELGYARVVRWLLEARPAEGCAVGLGADGRVKVWGRIRNVDPTPDRFEMDPTGLARALERGRRAGLEPLVFLHSHLGGTPEPSARDRAGLRQGGVLLWPRTWVLIQVIFASGVGPRRLAPPGGGHG